MDLNVPTTAFSSPNGDAAARLAPVAMNSTRPTGHGVIWLVVVANDVALVLHHDGGFFGVVMPVLVAHDHHPARRAGVPNYLLPVDYGGRLVFDLGNAATPHLDARLFHTAGTGPNAHRARVFGVRLYPDIYAGPLAALADFASGWTTRVPLDDNALGLTSG
jgi:hypothetical protein